jgi:hypothetical protein
MTGHYWSYTRVVEGAGVQRNFDDYEVSRVYVELPKPEIETLDGAYVETGNFVKTLVLIGKSIWQAITNQSEQHDIDVDAARLERERCTTAEYRAYAIEYSQA